MAASAKVVADAITRRINYNFSKYFPEPVDIMALCSAIDEVAEFHAGCEELGSSDISIMVNEVLRKMGVAPSN